MRVASKADYNIFVPELIYQLNANSWGLIGKNPPVVINYSLLGFSSWPCLSTAEGIPPKMKVANLKYPMHR